MAEKSVKYFPSEISLSESGEVPSEVQILRVGKFNHPKYGAFEITKKTLAEMKQHFDNDVRRIDVAFDYFHDSDKIAAGWPKALELREGGAELWATDVSWTPRARKMLADKELRYFSPDFMTEWTDPESGEKFHNVLFGGGLTNRPFVKNMEPIVRLSEGEDQDENEIEIEIESPAEEGIELGGPGSGPRPGGGGGNATRDRVKARNAKRQIEARDKQVAFTKKSNAIKQGIASAKAERGESARIAQLSKERTAAKMAAAAARRKGLDETNVEEGDIQMDEKDQMIEELKAELAALKAELEKMKGEHASMLGEKMKAEEAKLMAERENKFTVLLSEGKACVAQKEAFLAGDMEKFIANAQAVNLSEKGTNQNSEKNETVGGDAADKVLKLAEDKCKKDAALDVAKAIRLVLAENADLAKQLK